MIKDYKCIVCKFVEERLVKRECEDDLQYCHCTPEYATMEKQDTLGVPGHQFKGDWFKNRGHY